MPDLNMNGVSVSVPNGATLLDAAEQIGVDIPTLCHLKGCTPETTCMLCAVLDVSRNTLVPACSTKAADGLQIDTECDAVQSARRDILNLLLSEHVGDCEAPCRRICPAHLDIPLMLREIERGDFESAAWIARRDLGIPVVLSHICPAPCEKGCRRGQLDEALVIREMHGWAATHLNSKPGLDRFAASNGKRVAVIGSGPSGLACAWTLLQLGCACTIYEEASAAGGVLREHATLSKEVLDEEIAWLERAGIEFCLGQSAPAVGEFDALVKPPEHALAVRAVALGKQAAQELVIEPASVSFSDRFDSKVGRVSEAEIQAAVAPSISTHVNPSQKEAARCLHCDCRKPESCKLRRYAETYGANARTFVASSRSPIQSIGLDEAVVLDAGKCIKCGLCIRITKDAGADVGLAFDVRGSDTRVAVPLGGTLPLGPARCADLVAESSSTRAVAFR